MATTQRSDPRPPAPRLRLFHNWLSLCGAAIAAAGVTGLVFFLLLELFSGDPGGYVAVMLVLPALVAVFGLIWIPLGMWRERRRLRRGLRPSLAGRWSIDLRLLARRDVGAGLLLGAVALSLSVLSLGAGSLEVLDFSESNRFCGQVCHGVMGPERAVYESSPHARIRCVECHVGSGAESYVRSKILGIRRLYAVTTGGYSRPIPTPIHDRRPAREMCESCHWPDRFIDYKVITRTYFLGDEANTPVRTRMLIKVGGAARSLDGGARGAAGSGIHFHMLVAHKVEYKALDPQRQQIIWVRMTHPDGHVDEYENRSAALDDAQRAALETRIMDCVDCHSRPAHRFTGPVDAVDRALELEALSRELPYVKVEAVRALDGHYTSREDAMRRIEQSLRTFYADNFPEVVEAREQDIDAAIRVVQEIFRRTIFPEMKADWRAHPDNIGHRRSPGCFRCHNDEMVSQTGKTIFRTCTKCHAVLAQGEDVRRVSADFETGRPFVHPDEEEAIREYTACTECHTGGIDIYE